MLDRWNRSHPLILGVAFAALGVLSFTNGHHITGPLYLGIGAYEVLTFFWSRRRADLDGRRTEGP